MTDYNITIRGKGGKWVALAVFIPAMLTAAFLPTVAIIMYAAITDSFGNFYMWLSMIVLQALWSYFTWDIKIK